MPLRPISAATSPSKTIAGVEGIRFRSIGHLVEHLEVALATLVPQPDDLEDVVPFDHPVGVVVDRLAGTREEPGRRVVRVGEDHVGIRLRALQGDPDPHLAERRPGERIGPGQVCEPMCRWIPKARPCRTRRSIRRAASWPTLSSSTKNSWNSSMMSRRHGGRRQAGILAV